MAKLLCISYCINFATQAKPASQPINQTTDRPTDDALHTRRNTQHTTHTHTNTKHINTQQTTQRTTHNAQHNTDTRAHAGATETTKKQICTATGGEQTIRDKWTHWGLSPGPSACEADVIPLHNVPICEDDPRLLYMADSKHV